MNRCWRIRDVALAALTALLAGCATNSGTVVLLPESEGRPAALQVAQGDRSVVLDRPYAAAELGSSGPRAATLTRDEVDALFGTALAAQPPRPATFTIPFDEGDALGAQAQRLIDEAIAALSRYPAAEVVIVGHTDLVGTDAFNDELARKRAESVRQALIARGVAADRIVAYGRGKREPVVSTADGVAEPRNRRAEITLR